MKRFTSGFSRILNMEMWSLIISIFLLQHSLVITEETHSATYPTRVILESSNDYNFTLLTLKALPVVPVTKDERKANEEVTNATWKSRGFSVKNVSAILSDFPYIPPRLRISSENLLSNASRTFFAPDETATLTLVVKPFGQYSMYLNFSYYIGMLPEKPLTQPTDEPTSSTRSANTGNNDSMTEPPAKIKPLTTSTTPFPIPTQSVTNMSLSSVEIPPDPIPIMHDMARKRRSVPSNESILGTDEAPTSNITPTKNDSAPSGSGSTIMPEPPKINRSISLDQAVEMLKAAADVIANGAPHASSSTGHTDPLANEVPTKSNAVPAATTINPIKETKSMRRAHEILEEDTATELAETGDHYHRHHRHNSQTIEGVANNSRRGSPSKNARKFDKVRRIKGKTNDNEKVDGHGSSSSSEENAIYKHQGGNKKVSYKTWKASFQKVNRPPGLYVSVNDDVVFDNWEGVWEKDYLLGRWTGANLPEGMWWNQTQLFMNWEENPTKDVKITFEWDPIINGNSYVVITDVVASYIATTPCPAQPAPVPEHSWSAGLPVGNDKPSQPIVIIKPTQDGNDPSSWQIFKVDKPDENLNYKDMFKKQNNMTQATLIGQVRDNDELVKVLSKAIQGDAPTSPASAKEANKAASEIVSHASPFLTSSPTPEPIPTAKPSNTTILSKDITSKEATSSTAAPSSTSSTTTTSTTTSVPTPTSGATTAAPSTTSPRPTEASTAARESSSTTPHQSNNEVGSRVRAPIPVDPETRQKNEDKESALLVSVVTGSIALSVLVLTLKTYFAGSSKQQRQAEP